MKEKILNHINKMEELTRILSFVVNKFCDSREQCMTQIKNPCDKELIYKYLVELNNMAEITKKIIEAIRWEAFNIAAVEKDEKNIYNYCKLIAMNEDFLTNIIEYRDIIEKIYNL